MNAPLQLSRRDLLKGTSLLVVSFSLAPHMDAMRARLAETLGLPADVVNVKAKTAEKMGPVGELKAIEARAVCLLQRIETR